MVSKQTLDSIRSKTDIVRLVQSYGVDLRKAGKSFKAKCIFHEDSTPSLDVDPERGTFKCFGCDAHGDVFGFVMAAEKVTFIEAVKKLAASAGVAIDSDRSYSRPSQQQAPDDDKAEKVFRRFSEPRIFTMDQWAPTARRFKESSWAKQEMLARGIDFDICLEAKLGWADNGHGLCKSEGEHEVFYEKPWIGFPYIYGDKVRLVKWRVAFSVGKGFVRPPGMDDCLFIDGEPDSMDAVFLTEGEIDALSIRMLGLRACSIPSGFQSKINKATKDYLLKFLKIYACVDNDDEGKALLRKLLSDFPAQKLSVVTIPAAFKDANGLLVKGCKRDLEMFRREFQGLVDNAKRPTSLSFSDLDAAFGDYLRRLQEKKAETFFEWPWPNVQKMAVIDRGQVVSIMSSRSGQGKTSFAVQVSLHNAMQLGRKIAYYTAEVGDPVEEMVPLVTAQLTGRDRNALGEMDVIKARKMCQDAEFYFGWDPDAKGWDDVAALLVMAVLRLGIDIIVIDHLDFIIRDADWSKQNSQKSLAMRWLKTNLARKHGVLVIVLKQRGAKENSKNKRRGQDAADVYDGSGPTTQVDDVDHAFVLHRPQRTKVSEEDGEDIYVNEASLILGKSRRKGKGASVATLVFRGSVGRFEQSEKKSQEAPAEEEPERNSSLPYRDD